MSCIGVSVCTRIWQSLDDTAYKFCCTVLSKEQLFSKRQTKGADLETHCKDSCGSRGI